MIYKKLIRPIFFLTNPEWIHRVIVFWLNIWSRVWPVNSIISKICNYNSKDLETKIGDLTFKNPIGLAAGFDKDISAPLAYPMLGFGFVEFGSITWQAQPGNPKPRLWRIPKDKGLIVYYGLNNCGAVEAKKRLERLENKNLKYGVSIALSTKDYKSDEEMIEDYEKSFLELCYVACYVTLNVSCPNVMACSAFGAVDFIEKLVRRIVEIKQEKNINKQIFIKISPDYSDEDLNKVIDICLENKIDGIVAVNLSKTRECIINQKSTPDEMDHPGGISGELIKNRSTEVIRKIRERAGDKLIIIGVGGIFNAKDAWEKMQAGASAVQLVTGFIYGGPMILKKINKELDKIIEEQKIKP